MNAPFHRLYECNMAIQILKFDTLLSPTLLLSQGKGTGNRRAKTAPRKAPGVSARCSQIWTTMKVLYLGLTCRAVLACLLILQAMLCVYPAIYECALTVATLTNAMCPLRAQGHGSEGVTPSTSAAGSPPADRPNGSGSSPDGGASGTPSTTASPSGAKPPPVPAASRLSAQSIHGLSAQWHTSMEGQ